MHVRGVTEQHDSAIAVTLDVPGVLPVDPAKGVRACVFRLPERDVDAENAPCAVAEFGQSHWNVGDWRAELEGPEQRPARLEFGVDDPAPVKAAVAEGKQSESRNLDTAVG